jgi:NAD(P)-dependent dehydrogenase (short-subunit alcohol dehydrogenase family)
MSNRHEVEIVTRASRGRRAALVQGFPDRGYCVVANSRSIEPHASGHVLTLLDDVGDPKAADRIVNGAPERFGEIVPSRLGQQKR